MAKKGTNTKEKILANTEALFLEKGYSGTAIDDILGRLVIHGDEKGFDVSLQEATPRKSIFWQTVRVKQR